MFKFIILFFLLFIKNSFCNEVVAIKTYDRDSYIRIMFETTEKPTYFVKQEENNKISVKLPNTIIKTDLHKNIFKLNIIKDIDLINNTNDITFFILTNGNASLMRYLYTEPSSITQYYRVIVDIYKNDNLTNSSIDDLVDNLNINENKKITSIDDLIKENTEEKESIDDLIKENVKAKNMNELLALNNIVDEEKIIRSFEEQNNEEVDMDDFIKSISINFDDKIVSKKSNIKKNIVQVKKYTVVIDAGHGGKDPGAIGGLKTKEKDVNLIYAKAIKQELEKNKRINVVLTRSTDVFVDLKNRVNRARFLNADLFISIHSDSSVNMKARGLSIYTLMKSASDTRTVELMTQNKYSYWKNKIKYDSIRYKTLAESTKFTNILIKDFKNKNIKMFGNPHKYGNFAVLLAPEFPSVLIELGFLSNIQDERMLKSYSYKITVSKSIAQSIFNYFKI